MRKRSKVTEAEKQETEKIVDQAAQQLAEILFAYIMEREAAKKSEDTTINHA